MLSKRYSSTILYPFTPEAEPHRDLICGVQDILLRMQPAVSTPPPSLPPGTYDRGAWLYDLSVTGGLATYTIYMYAEGIWISHIFRTPIGHGYTVVRSLSDVGSVMTLNTDIMPPDGVYPALWAPVEPARIVYMLEGVQTVRLMNEYRYHDPAERKVVLDNEADTTVLRLRYPGDTLRLVDGYNCRLEYNPDTETLTIKGNPGTGKGRSGVIPWDSNAPDIFTGIQDVNAQNSSGNMDMTTKDSLQLSTGPATIHFRILNKG